MIKIALNPTKLASIQIKSILFIYLFDKQITHRNLHPRDKNWRRLENESLHFSCTHKNKTVAFWLTKFWCGARHCQACYFSKIRSKNTFTWLGICHLSVSHSRSISFSHFLSSPNQQSFNLIKVSPSLVSSHRPWTHPRSAETKRPVPVSLLRRRRNNKTCPPKMSRRFWNRLRMPNCWALWKRPPLSTPRSSTPSDP